MSPPPEGERCRAYAAGGSLRVPGRLNITWADDNTLKIDMDSGTQTRLLHFNSSQPAPAQRTLQGYSVATWETGRGGGGERRSGGDDMRLRGTIAVLIVGFSSVAGLSEAGPGSLTPATEEGWPPGTAGDPVASVRSTVPRTAAS